MYSIPFEDGRLKTDEIKTLYKESQKNDMAREDNYALLVTKDMKKYGLQHESTQADNYADNA